MATPETITIENVRPLRRVTIPLPESGVVVLRGRNGVGKSHALEAVDALVSRRGKLVCRDHAKGGLVEGFGARITVGRSTRHKGEAEVTTLEGRLDISQLVAPPIKDVEAADRQRIKALVQLSGATVPPSAFYDLLPDGTDRALIPDDEPDPVLLAGRVKRELEADARRSEKSADESFARAKALTSESIDEIEPGADVPSRQEAEQELQQALVELRELETRRDEASRHADAVQKARREIEILRSKTAGLDSVEQLKAEIAQAGVDIDRLQRQIEVANERKAQLTRQLCQAELAEKRMVALEHLVNRTPEPVDHSQIDSLAERVQQCRRNHDRSIAIERALQLSRQAAELQQTGQKEQQRAEQLRDAAHATDDILTELVSMITDRLRVEEGQLVTDTDRGAEPFSELSPGERWRIALEIAAEALGKGGLFTVPQEAWESLDPVNRVEVIRIAHRVGITILTAEASFEDELKVESM